MRKLTLTLGNLEWDVEEYLVFFVVKPLFLVFLYYGMFSRYAGPLGLSGGMTAVLVATALFFICAFHLLFVSREYHLSRLSLWMTVFFILTALTPILSFLIFSQRPDIAFKLSLEYGVAFFMFFMAFYMIRSGIITPKFFIYSIALVGTIAALQLLVTIIGEVRLGRLRGLGGLNYIGSSFTVSTIAWVMIIYSDYMKEQGLRRHLFNILGFLLVFLVMLLTGTRAAILAFLVGIVFLQFFGMKSKRFKRYAIVLALLSAVVVFLIAINIDLSRLWDRYTVERLMDAVYTRLNRYIRAVDDLTLAEFLFGRPDLYEFPYGQISGERYINTHNLFLSLVRYNGMAPFLLFVFLLAIIVFQYHRLYQKNKSNIRFRLTESSLLIFLVLVMVYAMISGGKSTRIFAVYLILGYGVGYFDLIKRVRSIEDYKKMIL